MRGAIGLDELRNGFPQEFEVHTSDSDRTLQYVLRPMRACDDTSAPLKDARNVLVVTDQVPPFPTLAVPTIVLPS